MMLISCNQGPKQNQNSKLEDEVNPYRTLIMNAFMMSSNIKEPNAAILISDLNISNEISTLMLAERNIYHTCGYDYAFYFWDDDNSYIDETQINSECEAFGLKPKEAWQIVNKYKPILENSPSHYIFDIELDNSTSPTTAKRELENIRLETFFIDDTLNRYPGFFLGFRQNTFVGKESSNSKWKIAEEENKMRAIQKLNSLVNIAELKGKVIFKDEIQFNSMGVAGDEMTHSGGRMLRFEMKDNVNEIASLLKEQGAKVSNIKVDSTYHIQIVDTTNQLSIIKEKVQDLKFIRGVYKYDQNK